MKRWLLPSLLLVLVLAAWRWSPEEPAGSPPPAVTNGTAPAVSDGALRVVLRGVDAARGRAALALFGDEAAFAADRPLRSVRLAPGVAAWEVEGLPAGTYAVKAYQDLDDDGRLDKGAFGVPAEPYGFSNGARGTFGPPDFAEASFAFDGTRGAITLDLR